MAYIPFPTGTVLTFAGSTAPDGWLLCDGSTVSRTTYARLFAVLSTTYGSGDGSTTFTLPDMRGVYPRGAGTNGTANYGGVTGHTPAGGVLGSKGGQKTAKNGLTASSGTSSLSALTMNSNTTSVSGNKNQLDNSTGSASNTSWLLGVLGSTTNQFSWFGHSLSRGGTLSGGNGDGSFPGQDHTHGFSYSGTFSASGTTPAQSLNSSTVAAPTITVGAGDTETTPAFLAINYIIKL